MMDGNYDGSVVIKTGLDLNTIEKDAESLKKAIEAATKGAKELQDIAKASGAAQISMLRQANAGWNEQLQILTKIREVMGGSFMLPAASTTSRTAKPRVVSETAEQVETAEYAELRKQAEALDKQLDKTVEKIDKMVALYGQANVQGMKSFQSLQYDLNKQQEQYDRIVDRMRELESDGKKYQTTMTETIPQQAKSVETLTKSYTQLATVTKRAQTEAVKTTTAVTKHGGISFKNILKYALGIRSMFFLMRRIRAVAKESLGVVAQYDERLNGVISEFMTSVKQLKADFGSMLQPLVQVGAPILTWLIDKVSTVTVELARFFAALSGQDYINRATVQAVDYADSLDKVSESAEKALGSYDKLNIISDNSKDTKSTLKLTKDTVKYTKEALNNNSWTVKLGRRLNEIFKTVGEKLKKIKNWLMEQPWIQNLVGDLKDLLNDPDKLLITIGAVGLGVKLGKILAAKLVTGMSEAGITSKISGLFPSAIAIAATIVIGYKIGNKIYDEMPDELKDLLGEQTAKFLENPFAAVAEGAKAIADEMQRKIDEALEAARKRAEEKNKQPDKTDSKTPLQNVKEVLDTWWLDITSIFSGEELPDEVKQNEENLKKDIKKKIKKSLSEEIEFWLNEAKTQFEAVTGLDLSNPKPEARKPRENKPEEKKQTHTFTAEEIEELRRKRQEALDAIIAQLEPLKAQFEVQFETKYGTSLKDALASIKEKLTNAWNNENNPVKNGLSTLKKGFAALWNSIFAGSDEQKNTTTIGDALKKAKNWLHKLWYGEDNPVKAETTAEKSSFAKWFDSIFYNRDDQTETYKGDLTNAKKKMHTLWYGEENPVKGETTAEKTSFGTWFNNIFNVNATTSLSTVQIALIKTRLAAVGVKIKSMWNSKDNPLKTTIDTLKDGFKTWWNNIFNPGTEEKTPEVTVPEVTKKNAKSKGEILALNVASGFKDYFEKDTTLDKTIVTKVAGALSTGYTFAETGRIAAANAIAQGKATSTTSKSFTTETTKQGDIVLKLDGNEVSRVVWDKTTKQYKQSGKSSVSLLV